MKLSFWTLGMPAWSNAEFARKAADLGYDGIDLRCTRPEGGRPTDLGNLSVETPDSELAAIKATYESAGIEISTLLCYNRGGHGGEGPPDWDEVVEDFAAHARVAGKLGCPRVRFTVGRPADGSTWEAYLADLAKAAIAAVSGEPGLTAIFENHVGSASARQLFEMADKAADPRVGVMFSPDHCIVMQEDTVGLAERYAPYIQQVCFSDRRAVAEDQGRFDGRYYYVRYEACMNGEGLVPAAKLFDALAERGYEGYVALKWEKSARFGHHLPGGEVALPQFIEFMKAFGWRPGR